MRGCDTRHTGLNQQLTMDHVLGVRGKTVDLDADPFFPLEQVCCPDAVDGWDAHKATPLRSGTRGGNGALTSRRGLGGGGGGAGLGSVVTFSSWMLLISRMSSLMS